MALISKTLYALFIALLVGVTGLFLATLLPIPGNIEVKIVKSGSMEPTIMTGSVVIVKPQETYSIGDVVTFGEDTKTAIPTTHRIIEVVGEGRNASFITQGDANEERDPEPVRQNDVIGRVIFFAPHVGYMLDFARQPIGFTLMIGIPAAIIVLDELVKIYAEVRRMRSKKRDEDDAGTITYSRSDSPRTRDLDLMTSHTTSRTLDLRHTI